MKNLKLKRALAAACCALVFGVSANMLHAAEPTKDPVKAEMNELGLVPAGENLGENQGAVPKDFDTNIPGAWAVPAPEFDNLKEDPANLGFVPKLAPEHSIPAFTGESIEKLVDAKDGMGKVPQDILTTPATTLPAFTGNLHIEGGVYNPVKTEAAKTEVTKPATDKTEVSKPAGDKTEVTKPASDKTEAAKATQLKAAKAVKAESAQGGKTLPKTGESSMAALALIPMLGAALVFALKQRVFNR